MSLAPETGRRRWLVLASAVASFFAVGVGFFSVPPLLPLLAARFGLDNLMAGVLMGSIAVPAIALSVPLGAGIDRWSPRAAGAVGLVLMALGGFLCAGATGYAQLLVGRVVFGIGGLVINLLGARLLARVFAGRELSLAMALFLAAYPVSMIACFTVQPGVETALGWRAALALAPALSLLALPLHLAVVGAESQRPAAAPAGQSLRTAINRPLLALALAWCLFFAAYAALITFAPGWAGRSGLLIVSTVAWVSMVASPPAGVIIDRTGGARWWAAGGLLALAATFAAMASLQPRPMLAMAAVGVVVAFVPTAVYSLPSRLVAAESVGFAFGLITSFSNLGAVLGPALAGAVRDRTPGWPVLWTAAAAVAVVAAILALAARPPLRRRVAR
jgi:predicted MFS family arabinose efflux permease